MPVTARKTPPTVHPCRQPAVCCSRGCGKPAVTGSRFCAECRARLADIREQLTAEGQAKRKGGRIRRRPGRCATLTCNHDAEPGSAYCLSCLETPGPSNTQLA